MNIFNRNKAADTNADHSKLAEIALNAIHDGVIMTDRSGIIQFINPSAIQMTNCGSAHNAIGLDYGLVVKLESKEGRELTERDNPLIIAMRSGQPLEPTQAMLIVSQSDQRLPISISVQVAGDASQNRIITFRNITKELEEEGEQTEFISTASHEMRTPVATIDGYLSLCLNPQTATIDERARGYLAAAEKASKHLGKLFQDLLDVTKLDDGHIKPHFEPAEMVQLVESISNDYVERAKEAKLTFNFGSSEPVAFGDNHRMAQVVYGFVDMNFMHEIMDNLIENAIKYTPAGGSIYVNVRGDGDRVLINVTDTGIGISAEDLGHIFQKFYRVDNSDTRTIGGTGLGLYLVKQRTEAMGGKVWAESAFGEGSTFYVSLPRLTSDEYEKRMIVVRNQQLMAQATQQTPAPTSPAQAPAPSVQPVTAPAPPVQPSTPLPQPSVPPVQPSAPLPQSPVPLAQPPTAAPPAQPTNTSTTPMQPPTPPTPPLTPPAQPTGTPTPIVNNPNINLNGEPK